MGDSPIGLIGVGLLGSALAERMLAGGLTVLGYDSEAGCLERLAACGGARAGNAAEVLSACECVVVCLPNSGVVQRVLGECEGVLRSGQSLVDATTGDPEDSEHMAADLAARGIGYMAATIAGSSEQVRRGEAVVIVGGGAAECRRAERVVATWGERRFVVGSAEASARFKLVVNLVLGLNRAVLAEGLALAQACGIEPAAALEVLKVTPAYSRVMDAKGPKMVEREYQPQARLAQHLKDVRLIRELATRLGARTPLSDLHEQLLVRGCELGYSEADNAAIFEAFKTGG